MLDSNSIAYNVCHAENLENVRDAFVWNREIRISHCLIVHTMQLTRRLSLQVRFCSLWTSRTRNRIRLFPTVVQEIAIDQFLRSLPRCLFNETRWCNSVRRNGRPNGRAKARAHLFDPFDYNPVNFNGMSSHVRDLGSIFCFPSHCPANASRVECRWTAGRQLCVKY